MTNTKLININLDFVPEPFSPDRNYWSALDKQKHPKKLEQKALERFPFVPEINDFNPNIKHDALLKEFLKGDYIISLMQRTDREFLDMVRQKSLERDIELRKERRIAKAELDYDRFIANELLKSDIKKKELLAYKFKKQTERHRGFLLLRMEALDEFLKRSKEMYKSARERAEREQDLYFIAFDKAHEKHPKQMVMSSTNSQRILAELPYSDFSKVVRYLEFVNDNLEIARAEQLKENFSGAMPPNILYHSDPFKRNEWEKEQKIINYERAHEFLMERMKRKDSSLLEELKLKAEIQIARSKKTHEAYWQAFDKNHNPVPRGSPLSVTNIQSARNESPYDIPSVINRWIRSVRDNILAAHADQIKEHLDESMPTTVRFNITIFDKKELKPIDFLKMREAQSERKMHRAEVLDSSWQKFDSEAQQRFEIRSIAAEKFAKDVEIEQENNMMRYEAQSMRSLESRETYWRLYDEKHNSEPRTLIATSYNPQNILAHRPYMEPNQVFYIWARAKNNILAATDAQAQIFAQNPELLDLAEKPNEALKEINKVDLKSIKPEVESYKDVSEKTYSDKNLVKSLKRDFDD